MNKRTIIVISVVGVLALGLLSFMVVKRKNKVGCNDSILFLGDSQTTTSDGYVERYIKKVPLGRMGIEDDIKGLIALLSSDLSRYITGQDLALDGGFTVH